MIISEQDLIGLPIDTGLCDATQQVAFHLLNNLFGEDNGAVGIEERVRVARDSAVPRASGETVHDRSGL